MATKQGYTRGMGSGFRNIGPDDEIRPGSYQEVPDPTQVLERIAKAVEALAGEFALPPLWQPTIINLAAGASQRIDSLTRDVASIIVSITAGKLDVWVGDESGNPTGIPHMEFGVTGAPVQIVFPPHSRVFTVLANGAPTTGCFIMASV